VATKSQRYPSFRADGHGLQSGLTDRKSQATYLGKSLHTLPLRLMNPITEVRMRASNLAIAHDRAREFLREHAAPGVYRRPSLIEIKPCDTLRHTSVELPADSSIFRRGACLHGSCLPVR
jgi:hypothetical protein